jgi:hypothetical protein
MKFQHEKPLDSARKSNEIAGQPSPLEPVPKHSPMPGLQTDMTVGCAPQRRFDISHCLLMPWAQACPPAQRAVADKATTSAYEREAVIPQADGSKA